jgi:plastocyanin
MNWVSVIIGAASAALALSGNALAYEGGAVSNGGTIKGQVKYEGAPPAREKIEITKDAKVCGTETEKLKEDLVVGAGGGIANVVVRLSNISKGAALEPAKPNPTLDQKVCQFRPHVLVFPAGSTLDVLNSDGILHNVHTYAEVNPAVNKAQPGFKKQIQLKFEKPEFPIRAECDAHPWMKAWLVVQEHPYYAVTDESGNFSMSNVPAGDYEIEAWQETLGKKTGTVSVTAGGEATVTIGFAAQ